MINYYQYIQSEEWRLKKEKFKASRLWRDGRCYVCCNKGIEVHIHHITYENLGNEKLNDLRILCAVCHAAVHETKSLRNKRMKQKWAAHASRMKLWGLRRFPLRYALEVSKFFKVTQHEFVERTFSGPALKLIG